MLLRFVIQNFLSFYDRTIFDMFPNPRREGLQNHIYDSKIPLLKQAAIYGENGSGKSNFVKAIWFIKSFVIDGGFLKHINIDDFRFQLSNTKGLPISLSVEFYQNSRYYIYEVNISNKIVEKLFRSGIGEKENELILERDGIVVKSLLMQNEDATKQLLQKNNFSSIISLNKDFPVLKKCKEIDDLNNWFANIDVVTIKSEIPVLIELLSKKKSMFDFANDVFSHVGITNSLLIQETPIEEWLSHKNDSGVLKSIIERSNISETSGLIAKQNNRDAFVISGEKGREVVKEFFFEQIGVSGYSKKMSFLSQSDGTVRLLILIPAIFDAIKNHKVVIIDEIENSIHPNLIYKLVKYYADRQTNGQMIFTTHLTKFQNQQEVMRPDEIWLTEKKNGCTSMRSLNDFKIHHTKSIEKGYLEGRYGGVPIISQVASDEK